MYKKQKITQEFRQDIFTGEWVLVSTNRDNKPYTIVPKQAEFSNLTNIVNPFEDIVEGKAKEKIILEMT